MLGTSVLTPTFRYNPAVLAQQLATIALLNPGRVVLGVGTGEALNEISVGLPEWPDFKERWARLREAVRLMRELWAGERVTFDGDYYRTVDATIYDRPEGRRPDLGGGRVDRRWRSTPGARATASSAPAARAWTSTPTSCCRPSTRGLAAVGPPPRATSPG